MTTPPVDPGRIRRGDVVMIWDPQAGRLYRQYYMVISNDRSHSARDDVQVVEIDRPFRPASVTRTRLKRLGHARSKLPKFEAGLRDLISAGEDDPPIDARGYPRAVVELPVSYTDGIGSKNRPVVILSRPLLWSAYKMVFFADISRGIFTAADYRMQYPDWVGATPTAFIKGRIWWADVEEVVLYNPYRAVPAKLHLQDWRGLMETLDNVLELGLKVSS